MKKQHLTIHGLKALTIALLSTTLTFSCSQIQAQNLTKPIQMTSQASSLNPQITREDNFVNSDPGIQIFVRKVQLNSPSNNARVSVLLIHGGGPGSVTSFDIDVPGYSVAADIAEAGHPVYLMNVRGWEQSTRPPALNQPPQQNPPTVTSFEAVRDISAVVNWIGQRESGRKVVKASKVKTVTIKDGTHYLFLDRPQRGRDCAERTALWAIASCKRCCHSCPKETGLQISQRYSVANPLKYSCVNEL